MLPQENLRLERVKFALRATGVSKGRQTNPLRSGIHTRGYLPHVKREGARYFVTFRLADSLPKEVLFKILQERVNQVRRLESQATQGPDVNESRSEALRKIERDYFRKIEEYLDKGCGECWLRNNAISAQVSHTLCLLDKVHYEIKAWAIMPNHVHAVLWPMANHTLSEILKKWKGPSAREANRLLGRANKSFWQPESYDHWIRDDLECDRCCQYVIYNPVKAGLCRTPEEWRWSSAWRGGT